MRLGTVLCALAIAVCCGVFWVDAARAEPAGEVVFGVGGVWPQGEFASYSDPGYSLLGQVRFEIPRVPALKAWGGLTFTGFSSERISTDIIAGDITIPGEQTTSQTAFSVHLGLQLGSSSRNAFFRPRVGVAGGFYFFDTSISFRTDDQQAGEEPFYSESIDSHACVGWRGVVGADFFFVPAWGVSVEAVYDHVLGLRRLEVETESDRTARFQGFTACVVIPFGP